MSQPPRQSGHSGSAPGAALIPKLSSNARDAHPSYHSDPGVVLVLVDPALTPILCGVEATRPIKCLSAGLTFLRTRAILLLYVNTTNRRSAHRHLRRRREMTAVFADGDDVVRAAVHGG
jgi:hypothetical protein